MGFVGTTTLGQHLLKKGLITEEQLIHALKIQRLEGIKIGTALVRLGFISEDRLFQEMSEMYGYPFIDILKVEKDPQVMKLIPQSIMLKYKIVPFAKEGEHIKIAITDPSTTLIDYLNFLLSGFKVKIYLTKDSSMNQFLSSLSAEPQQVDFESTMFDDLVSSVVSEFKEIEEEKVEEERIVKVDAPIIKLANKIIGNAIKMRASDIHIEPDEKGINVRYRIDGALVQVLTLPKKIKSALTTRFKIMSHLDISERRLPQDGRIRAVISGKEVDFRVSTLPVIHGEKIVLRILEKGSLQLDLTKLGFEEISLRFFLDALEKPYGMILVTGPTGSGKTTTLYSALMRLNRPEINIMTVEDPVEYSFPGINQVQVREDIGLTFATALRAFLRQDPDIIMVGEIRDFETAEIAVKAALTGHLVLSTLHTNDAPSTITRLINMGIEPFLISSSVILVVAQRLVRRLCPHCKRESSVPKDTLLRLGFREDEIEKLRVFEPVGCTDCNMSGYRGRIALYEVMPITDEIRELILTGANAIDIKRQALKHGMITLRRSGLYKVMNGLTSIKEVLRTTFED